MDVRTVVQFAAFTRVLTLVLQAVFNALIPDHAADAFSPPRVEEGGPLDGVVEALLGGLSRWDAEHFLFIAERGYVFEHNHAFFPLLPLGLRATAGVLRPLAGWLSLRGRLLLAVAVLNSGLFVLSAAALYGLGRVVLRDRRLALLSSLLFCLTPANVFLAAGYSEALFSALTFTGLGALEGGAPLRASLLLSLATACRANGLANTGFLVYLPLRWGLAQAGGVCRGAGGLGRGLRLVGVGLRFLLTAAEGCVLVALPFAVFQLYGYRTFCTPSLLPEEVPPALLALARVKGYRVPDATQPPPPWCHAWPPLLYSYIQDAYWDVGFLRYFQLRQTPNFLLALPVALLVAMAAWTYAAASPALCLRLGLWGERLMGGAGKPASGFLNPRVFVYVVHAGVLLVFGFFCMHVQVLTRFLASSSPVLYWFSAHLLLHHEPLLQEEQQQDELQEEQQEEQQQDELQEEQEQDELQEEQQQGELQEEQEQDELQEEQQEEQQQDELQEEQEQEQKQKEQGSSLHLPRVVWGDLSHNPVTHLLLQWRCCSTLSRWLLGYFTSYWLLGLALHCNFLPWT